MAQRTLKHFLSCTILRTFGIQFTRFRTNCQNLAVLGFFLKKWDSFNTRLNSHYKAWSQKKKKHTKIKAYRKSLQKEP